MTDLITAQDRRREIALENARLQAQRTLERLTQGIATLAKNNTPVTAKTTATWNVTLKKGTYRFVCDPHATIMKGSFTVA